MNKNTKVRAAYYIANLLITLIFSTNSFAQIAEKKHPIKGEVFTVETHDHFPEFDVKDVPFSYPKSAFSVCNNQRTHGLALTDIRFANFGRNNQIFKFLYLSGSDTLEPRALATPEKLVLSNGDKAFVTACFESEKIFRIQGTGVPMILMLDKDLLLNNRLKVTITDKNRIHIENRNQFGTSYYILTCLTGSLKYLEEKHLFSVFPSAGDVYSISVEESDSVWTSIGVKKSFDNCIALAHQSFNTWLSKMPSLPTIYA